MTSGERARQTVVRVAEIISDDWWRDNRDNGRTTTNAKKALAKIKGALMQHESEERRIKVEKMRAYNEGDDE